MKSGKRWVAKCFSKKLRLTEEELQAAVAAGTEALEWDGQEGNNSTAARVARAARARAASEKRREGGEAATTGKQQGTKRPRSDRLLSGPLLAATATAANATTATTAKRICVGVRRDEEGTGRGERGVEDGDEDEELGGEGGEEEEEEEEEEVAGSGQALWALAALAMAECLTSPPVRGSHH